MRVQPPTRVEVEKIMTAVRSTPKPPDLSDEDYEYALNGLDEWLTNTRNEYEDGLDE